MQKGLFVIGASLPTIPFAIKANRGALKPQERGKLAPAMANNVLVVLLTQLLLGIGYILAWAL